MKFSRIRNQGILEGIVKILFAFPLEINTFMEPEQKNFKVVMLGATSVGKSSLLIRLTKNFFEDQVEATLCSAYVQHKIQLSPSRKVLLHVC